MKTKKLIELLQKEDPSGDTEVVVCTEEGNIDIRYLEVKAGYWDGVYQVFERDESITDCCNIVGAQIRSKGNKLCIIPQSIEDALFDDTSLPVTYDSEYARESKEKNVNKWRSDAIRRIKEGKDIHFEEFQKKFIPRMLKENLKVLQPLDSDIGTYNVMWLVKNPKKFKPYKKEHGYKINVSDKNQEHLCQGDCGVIIERGLFDPVKKEKYIEWEYKNEND